MDRIFKRKLYDKLLEWKRVQNGKTAILIEGARRVGYYFSDTEKNLNEKNGFHKACVKENM